MSEEEEHTAKVPWKTKAKKSIKTKYLKQFIHPSINEESKEEIYGNYFDNDNSLNKMVDEFVGNDQQNFDSYLEDNEINEIQDKCDCDVGMIELEDTPSYNYRNAYKGPTYASMKKYITNSPVK